METRSKSKREIKAGKEEVLHCEESVEQRMEQLKDLIQKVILQMQMEIDKIHFPGPPIHMMTTEQASFCLEKDPANGRNSLLGIWRDSRQQKVGSLLFHAGGEFFAEFDIVRPHPNKPKWFVEAVSAWGTPTQIKSEARLIPMP